MEGALSLVPASFYNAECCQAVVVVEDKELVEVVVVVEVVVTLVAVVR